VLALAWMLRQDYAAVGFKLIPPGGARSIGVQMTASAALLLPASWLPTLLGSTGSLYAAGATALGLAFLLLAAHAARDLTETAARRVFLGSLVYHPVLLALMLFDTVRP
jgi:protoheme IX farnesyltransferase